MQIKWSNKDHTKGEKAMNLDTILGISILAVAVIAYAISRLPRRTRLKYVDQKVKERGEREYVIVLYI